MFFLAPLAAAGAAAGATATGGAFLSAVAPALLQMGIGFGLQALAKSMSTPGIRGELARGADVPLSIMFGKWATSGCLEYFNEWGRAGFLGATPNAYLTQVISISDIPVKGLTGIWVDGERRTLLWAEADPEMGVPVEEFRKGQRDHLWVKFYDGTQTSADPFLVNEVSEEARPWDNTAVLTGVAYAVVTARIANDLWTQAPQYIFEIDGARLYDPSRDDTVGGNGPQRWGDPSTWGGDGDDLPAVQIFNLLRGIQYQDEWVFGMQDSPASSFPMDRWIAAIEACRAPIDHPDGGTVASFRSGYEVRTAPDDLGSTIQHLLLAMNGRPDFNAGRFSISPSSAVDPVATLTDADLISTAEQTYTPFTPARDMWNGVSSQFADPEQAWQMNAVPVYSRADLEAEDDGQRRLSGVTFEAVSDAYQVARLQKSLLDEYRRQRRHVVTLPPRYQPLEVHDVISWTSVVNGYDGKLFRVDGKSDQPNLDVVLELTEVDPSDYSYDIADYVPPVRGSVVTPVLQPQVLPGFSAQPASVPDANGVGKLPAIEVSWTPDYLDDVAAVRVAARVKSGDGKIYEWRSDDVSGASFLLVAGLLPAETYEVRGLLVPGSQRPTEWSDWIEVTTPDIRPGLGDLAADVAATVAAAQAAADDAAQASAAATAAANQVATQLTTATEDLTEALVAGDEAVLGEVQQLASQVGANAAQITQIDAARVSGDAALATSVSSLNAAIGGLSAQVTAQSTALAGVEDGLAAGFLVKAQADGEVSLLELIAASGSGEQASVARLSADDILLDGTVSTKKLVVYEANLCDNPYFETGTWSHWYGSVTTSIAAPIARSSIASSSFQAATFQDYVAILPATAGSNHLLLNQNVFMCKAGEKFTCSAAFWVSGSSFDPAVILGFRFFDIDGNHLAWRSTTTTLSENFKYQTVTTTQTAPAGAAKAVFYLGRAAQAGDIYRVFVQGISATRLHKGSTLIEPGGITTPQLASGSVISEHVVTGTLTAANIEANGIVKPVTATASGQVWLDNTYKTVHQFNVSLARTGDITVMAALAFDMSGGTPTCGWRISIGGQVVETYTLNQGSESATPIAIKTGLPAGSTTIKIEVTGGGNVAWRRSRVVANVVHQG